MGKIRKLISIFAILMLVLTIISFLSTNVFAETNVKEIVIYTDSSWKSFDTKVDGWTSLNFDDSYWLNPIEGDPVNGYDRARYISYPEKPSTPPFYFRKTFELSGTEIMSGKLYEHSYGGKVYVNDNYIGEPRFETMVDIVQYLKIGKNVIATEFPDNVGYWLLAKIRTVSSIQTAIITPIPSPLITSTIIQTPAPSGQTSKSASVSLTGEKTDVVFGEDIVLKLSAVNLITKPMMHVQVIILVPSGMSVTSSEFSKSGTNQFTANYELNPGDGKDVEVKIKPNQVGDFNVNGRIVYYFGDDKNTAEDNTLNLPIEVRGINPTLQPTPQPTTPGFDIEMAIIGILLICLILKHK